MATSKDYIKCTLSKEIRTVANYIARARILYEYPGHNPEAYGSYDDSHIKTIEKGLLAELALFEYFHCEMEKMCGRFLPPTRYEEIRNKFRYQITIGKPETEYEFLLRDKTLDVKSYGTKIVELERIEQLRLLVSKKQLGEKKPADIYVQAFFVDECTVVFAGYHKNLPEHIETNLQDPAYACYTSDLCPMTDLVELLK